MRLVEDKDSIIRLIFPFIDVGFKSTGLNLILHKNELEFVWKHALNFFDGFNNMLSKSSGTTILKLHIGLWVGLYAQNLSLDSWCQISF